MPTYLLSQKQTQPQITEICLSLALLKNTEKEIKKLKLACSSIEAYCMSLLVNQVKKKIGRCYFTCLLCWSSTIAHSLNSPFLNEIGTGCSGLAQICIACMIISLFPCMQTSTEMAFCGAEFVQYKILGHTPI